MKTTKNTVAMAPNKDPAWNAPLVDPTDDGTCAAIGMGVGPGTGGTVMGPSGGPSKVGTGISE